MAEVIYIQKYQVKESKVGSFSFGPCDGKFRNTSKVLSHMAHPDSDTMIKSSRQVDGVNMH